MTNGAVSLEHIEFHFLMFDPAMRVLIFIPKDWIQQDRQVNCTYTSKALKYAFDIIGHHWMWGINTARLPDRNEDNDFDASKHDHIADYHLKRKIYIRVSGFAGKVCPSTR